MAEEFLDSLYSSVKRKKLTVSNNNAVNCTLEKSASIPNKTRLEDLLATHSLLGVLDRVVPLDNFAAGKIKRKPRQQERGCEDFREVSESGVRELHALWCAYMRTTEGKGRELLGAEVKVVASENKANEGVGGVVVRCGKNAISVFCWKKKKVLVLPRDVCRFGVEYEKKICWIVDDRPIRKH